MPIDDLEAELAALRAQVEEMKPAGDMVCVRREDLKEALYYSSEAFEYRDAISRLKAALGKE